MVPRIALVQGGGGELVAAMVAENAVLLIARILDPNRLSALAAAIQENDHCVSPHAFARTQHHPPIVDSVFLQEQDFNLSTAAGLGSAESGRDDS